MEWADCLIIRSLWHQSAVHSGQQQQQRLVCVCSPSLPAQRSMWSHTTRGPSSCWTSGRRCSSWTHCSSSTSPEVTGGPSIYFSRITPGLHADPLQLGGVQPQKPCCSKLAAAAASTPSRLEIEGVHSASALHNILQPPMHAQGRLKMYIRKQPLEACPLLGEMHGPL